MSFNSDVHLGALFPSGPIGMAPVAAAIFKSMNQDKLNKETVNLLLDAGYDILNKTGITLRNNEKEYIIFMLYEYIIILYFK